MPLRIIDVSDYQGQAIDWSSVKRAGIAGAFCKCTEGCGYFDPTFPRNWGALGDLGLVQGAYAFSRPDLGNSPQQEAQYFLEHLPALDAGALLALDVETPTSGSGALDQWTLTWLQVVEQQTGVRPLIYTGEWFARGLGRLSAPQLGQYHLWDAAYQANQPAAYSPWSSITMWQHRSDLALPGVGLCDESLYDGTVDQLKALGKRAPQPQPKPAYPEAGEHLRLTVATHLRPHPAVDAAPLGRLLPAGTQVVEVEPPRGLAIETTHWAWVRTSGDVRGYIYLPDTVPYRP